MALSSAKSDTFVPSSSGSGKSLIIRINNNGEIKLPWGVPFWSLWGEDRDAPTLTLMVRSDRKSSIQSWICPWIPIFLSLWSSPSFQSRSKALVKSSSMAWVVSPLESDLWASSCNLESWSRVHLARRKPA